MKNITDRIIELQQSLDTKAKIRAALTLEDYTAKQINEAFKNMNVSTKAKTFASDFYSWLAIEPRERWEAEQYIMGEGEYGETSNNVKNHLSHYLNIWELTVTIWESK